METEDSTRETQEEPGIYANATDLAPPSVGNSQTRTSEDSTQKNTVIPGTIETVEETGMGGITELTASVRIPLEYFEGLAQRELGEGKEPDAGIVKTVIDREIPNMKQSIMTCIGLHSPKDDDRVMVDAYWAGASSGDLILRDSGDSRGAEQAAEAGSFTGIAGRYGKHIAVSALAFISLFMVLMMVRKAAGPVEMDEDKTTNLLHMKKPVDAFSLEDSNIADAEDGGGLLAGVELPEDAVQSQQILQQIKDMVTESPDAAATLVTNWISKR